MVEEGQGPGGRETGLEGEAPRATSRRRPARTAPAVEPPRAGVMPPHVASALVSALVLVLLAPGLFVAGYFTNAAVDDGGGTSAAAANPGTSGQTGTQVAQPTATAPAIVAASVDDDPAWGPEDAPVTIIEFSDFECPYCDRFFSETYPQIKQDYEGQIRFVYRDFPLSSIHPWAQKAAEAGECANEQGKFWEYHDVVFQSQTNINDSYQTAAQSGDASAGLAAAVDALKGLAPGVGLDSTAFDQCLDSGKYTAEVQKDYQDGLSYGVTGTPAFFINGVAVIGAQPYANFKAVIDAALQEAGGS
jgi:protein-disulfide isomerase